MEIGEAVRVGRLGMRLSQADLATIAGVSRQAIAALERSKGRIKTLVDVEAALHLHATGLAHGNSLIERIKATRLRQGLGLREAASKSGLSVNTVRQIEAARGNVGSMARLISALAPSADIRAGATRSQRRGLATVGRRHLDRDNPADYFATPAPVTRLLLRHERFPAHGPVLEPAVGKARAIDRVLREFGYETVCSDLNGIGEEQQDFFQVRARYPSIVTNPPYSCHLGFIRHAKVIAEEKFAMLLPVNYLTGARRHLEIWNDRAFPLARVYVLNRGVNFTASDPHGEKFKASQFYVAWFVFERAHRGSPNLVSIDCDPWVQRGAE